MATRTLLLNASFEPITLIPLKKAIVLVMTEKAEVVHMGNGEWRSASSSFPIPSVIKLTRYVKIPYRGGKQQLTRHNVLDRDAHTCQYCGKPGDTIDHVMPRSRGGAHTWENLVCACRPCNSKKDDKTLKELGWKLPRTPFAPRSSGWIVIGQLVPDESWEPYLAIA